MPGRTASEREGRFGRHFSSAVCWAAARTADTGTTFREAAEAISAVLAEAEVSEASEAEASEAEAQAAAGEIWFF